MKIVKIFSKFNDGFIAVLCINTGPNTFKANQYTNILYKLERKKEYNETYNFFGHRKKFIFIYIILAFFLSFIFTSFYFYTFRLELLKDKIKGFGYRILVRLFCKSLNSVFFITHNIIIFVNLYRLQKENIICFDKSRLINSGKINTIIFSKTGTLSYDSLEINSFHPLNFNAHKSGYISFKSYPCDKSKEMNMQLLNYYQGYLSKAVISKDSLLNSNTFKAQSSQLLNKLNMKSEEYCTLFIECLVTCNNIEKFNIEIFGNHIETAIFNEMKWDMKCYDSNNKENGFSEEINNNDTFFIDNKSIIIEKKICDIFPKNYFKITEASSKETKAEQRNKQNKACMLKQSKKLYISKKSNNFSQNNQIEKDLSKSYIYSYKLRIYKKFIKNGALNSGAIVYNFMTKELRFMIKGMPEDILEKCDKNLFPENLENIISFYRRSGLVIVVYATKKINLDEYKDLNDLDYYMNNLTLCGFITLKNKLKEETISSIQDLKEFDCNFIITSGDNVFNCLSVGLKSGIIENKNVYSFDIDNDTSKLIIRKINSNKNHNKEKEDSRTELSDKYSKQSTSLYANQKESSFGKNNNVLIRSSKTKKFNSNISNEFKDTKALHTPQIKLTKGSFVRKLSIKNYKKISKMLPENPEYEKIDNTVINSESYDINKEKGSTSKNSNLSRSQINNESKVLNRNLNSRNKIKYELKQIQENTSLKKSRNKSIRNINKYIFDFEKYYYYNGIFRDYEELNDNCIYCISGKAFNFLYENKKKKECKYLLEKIHKNCKIFFEMSSYDKTCSIDFYREHKNTTVCNIGECESDFDSIITSNVGISIKNPTNINTILCHFYYSNTNISCIKNIILEGRVLYENNILLEKVSFLCSMALNSYILCCLIRNIDTIESQLNFLEIEYLILAVFSFCGEPKNGSIFVEPLVKNRKLLRIYYIIELIGVLLVKLLAIYLFCSFYRSDFIYERERRDLTFVTFYFSLCIEFLVSIIYSFNLNSFYRKSPFSNVILIVLTLFLFIYLVIIVCLSSSNMKYDFIRITYFDFSTNLIDSFSDKNKLYLLMALAFDFVGSFILSTIIYYIFRLIAKMKLPKTDVM
jgi:magnesium-transporting ATPase (P-type)